MIISQPSYPQVRQRGNWVVVGDSINGTNSGSCVPWITQASFWPDIVTVTNLQINSQSCGPASLTTPIPAMISAAQLAACDALFDGSKDYNIVSISSALQDGANGRTDAQAYTDLTTFCAGRQAVGFKVIYIEPVRLDGGTFYSTPSGQTFRTNLITRANGNLAGFDAVVGIDGIPGTPGDGVNYNTDHIHLLTPGQTAFWNFVKPFWKTLVGLP